MAKSFQQFLAMMPRNELELVTLMLREIMIGFEAQTRYRFNTDLFWDYFDGKRTFRECLEPVVDAPTVEVSSKC